MHFFKTLLQAVQSWRRRRGGLRTAQRAGLSLEQLDHRQLLAVNFTGNVLIDFPDPTAPGSAIVNLRPTDPGTSVAVPNDMLASVIPVTGFNISAIRLTYTPSDDILSIGIQHPDNQKTGQQVIAGDPDDNLNGGTVSPAVHALNSDFLDFPFLGGTETMAVFLNLNDPNVPDVIAGISNDPAGTKLYQVANALVKPTPSGDPFSFGTQLVSNTGGAFLLNADPARPNFEFQITRFSELYKQKTGKDFTASSIIGVGALAGSVDDFANEMFIPAQPVKLNINPLPPPMCPISPPVVINPHQNSHVNIAHPTDVRVTIFGSNLFNAATIIPQSVMLGGATPIFSFLRDANHDGFQDATFVFRGSDLNLPPGVQQAVVTGTTTSGTTIRSNTKIFVRDESFYSPAEISARDARQAAAGFSPTNPPPTPGEKKFVLHQDLALEQSVQINAYETPTAPLRMSGPTIAIARRGRMPAKTGPTVAITRRGTPAQTIRVDSSM